MNTTHLLSPDFLYTTIGKIDASQNKGIFNSTLNNRYILDLLVKSGKVYENYIPWVVRYLDRGYAMKTPIVMFNITLLLDEIEEFKRVNKNREYENELYQYYDRGVVDFLHITKVNPIKYKYIGILVDDYSQQKVKFMNYRDLDRFKKISMLWNFNMEDGRNGTTFYTVIVDSETGIKIWDQTDLDSDMGDLHSNYIFDENNNDGYYEYEFENYPKWFEDYLDFDGDEDLEEVIMRLAIPRFDDDEFISL